MGCWGYITSCMVSSYIAGLIHCIKKKVVIFRYSIRKSFRVCVSVIFLTSHYSTSQLNMKYKISYNWIAFGAPILLCTLRRRTSLLQAQDGRRGHPLTGWILKSRLIAIFTQLSELECWYFVSLLSFLSFSHFSQTMVVHRCPNFYIHYQIFYAHHPEFTVPLI